MSEKLHRAKEKIRRWRESPASFVVENFGVEPDEWQLDAMEALGGSYNPRRRVCMKACTGPGKSAMLAWMGWHRLSCFGERGEHPKGAALSITRDNLKDNLWSELSKWQKRSEFLTSQFTWNNEKIYLNDHPETWFLSARSFAKDADAEAVGRALSGLHSRFPFILLDETGDMPVAVGRASEQIFTGSPVDAAIIQAGNPTSVSGLLYNVCTNLRESWVIITITADPDDPKRTPRVDIELAREQIKLYGRDNPWVMATILGLFPPGGFNTLVSLEQIEASMNRHYRTDQYDFAAKILGVDVARQGDDPSIIAPRQGLVGFKPKVLRNLRSTELAGQVSIAEDNWSADGVIVDGTGGWGAGVIDAGHQTGRVWLDCQFAGKPFSPKYANKRAENSFLFAEWIIKGGALPYLPELIREATAITYTFHGDKFIIEPKEIIKKRVGHSTDYWDAYSNTFAFPIHKKQYGIIAKPNLDYNPIANVGSEQGRTVFEYNPLN